MFTVIIILIILIIFFFITTFNYKEGFKIGSNNTTSNNNLFSNNNDKFYDNISLNINAYDKPLEENNTDRDLRQIARNGGINYDTTDYDKVWEISNNDLSYYYNDVINQSKINENAYDLINSIDKINYSNIKTGLDKCEAECNGSCFELGYTGNATCYPWPQQSFEWGTLYKNPTFTYGYNAFGPKNMNSNII